MQLTKEEQALYDLNMDRCKWARAYLRDPNNPRKAFSLKGRDYQKEVLEAEGKRQVWRMGRRVGKTVILCVRALHRAFIESNCHIVFVTPYESQIRVIFDDTIRPMIVDSPLISASVPKIRRSPYEILFSNGSKISGLTAGTRSGQHGDVIRGMSAKLLILDEADYLSPKSIGTIMALLATSPDTELIASSTPTGRREWFYDICTNPKLDNLYKRFHFPSSVSPNWTSNIEHEFRTTLPIEDYTHEFDAEFGSEAQGVFHPDYIDASLRFYDYKDTPLRKTPGNIRIIGVDWNEAKNGVQIVVTEAVKHPTKFQFYEENEDRSRGKKYEEIVEGKFMVIDHVEIHDKEFTQNKAIITIMRMMAEYNVDHLYVDEGHGSFNVEELMLRSRKTPQLEMKKKLRALNMSSKLKIRDPQTKKWEDKPIKPYMVSSARNYLEKDLVILPKHEDYEIGLIGQMRAYIIVRITDKGHPTYSAINDHALDAWMFSMLAFTQEYSELTSQKLARNIKYIEPERFGLTAGTTGRSIEKEDELIVHQEPYDKIAEAAQAMVGDDYKFVGWDDDLWSDEDHDLERRKKVHEAGGKKTRYAPFARSSRSRKIRGLPTRTNVTIGSSSRMRSGSI
jgi:replicative DNA helicase